MTLWERVQGEFVREGDAALDSLDRAASPGHQRRQGECISFMIVLLQAREKMMYRTLQRTA
jgi:hypothetical protein